MPINPLYYTESDGPQLVRDVMYKAPYEYLEKAEIAKAQTKSINKHAVNMLDSLLNIPVLSAKEKDLQASNEEYRRQIDALVEEVSGGTVTLETTNKLKNLSRQLSDEMKYGQRSLWMTQYDAKNLFMNRNLAIAKTDPALYNASVEQFEKKILEAKDKDELVELSSLTLSERPTFGLDNPDNLLRFEKLLQTESQSFYSTDKTVTEAAKKEFLRTTVASNPKKVKEFIETYMKSLPGYEAYLNSLHFAKTGEINTTPNKYQMDEIWKDPNHPYYKEAKALENALSSYSSRLSSNPAYIANIEADKAQQELVEEQSKNVGQPVAVQVQNNQVSQWQKLGEKQTAPGGIHTQSVAVRFSANKHLYNPKEQVRDWKQDAVAGIGGNNYNFSPKDKKKDFFTTEPTYVSKNKTYINKFKKELMLGLNSPASYDDLKRLLKKPSAFEDVTELVAISASNVLKRVPLSWEKTSGRGVTDLTDDTYKNLAEEIYKEIKPQFKVIIKANRTFKNAINSSIRVGLSDAVQAMANTRNIIDNTTFNYESYPVLQKAQGNALNSQSNLLVQQIVAQSDNFLVHHNIEGKENIKQNNGKDLKISELSDLLHDNNILSVTHRNSPGPLGALSYAITYKSKTAKKDEQPKTATVILKNIDSYESQLIYKDLSKIDEDAQSILRKVKTSTGKERYEQRPEVLDVNYARYVSLLYSGVQLITQNYEPGKSYSPEYISVNPEAKIWKSFGIPEVTAEDLYKAGGVVFNVEDDTIILPPSLFPGKNEVKAEEFYRNIPNLKLK